MIATGTYRPNQAGARTLAEAKPLVIDGKTVTVEVGETEATLFVGGRIAATRPSADFSTATQVYTWAQEASAETPAPTRAACDLNTDDVNRDLVRLTLNSTGEQVWAEVYGLRTYRNADGSGETYLRTNCGTRLFPADARLEVHPDPAAHRQEISRARRARRSR